MSGGDQFNPPGRLLFRIPFNVDAADAAGFFRFIEDVVGRLRNLIQDPRRHGTGTTALPRPQAAQRTWFVIELQSRDRETSYSVPVFIEAETIYLRGYQNQHRDLFEFAGGNDLFEFAGGTYLGGGSTRLTFSCNYGDLQPSTKQTGGDPGLALLPLPEPQQGSSEEVPRPNFGKERLRVAVRELAEGRNLRGQSQHRTAQNLLLVIVRFCESIRFRSIRVEMAKLWNVQSATGQPSRCLSQHHFGQIKNWNKLAINLRDSERRRHCWPRKLADVTGVRSATEAQAILDLVLFHKYENERNEPEWIPPDDDNNNRRRHGGAAGGAYAAELPVTRSLWVPEEPVMKIVRVCVPCQPGLRGVYGTVTLDNGLEAHKIFGRSRSSYQRYSGDSKVAQMTLSLNTLDLCVSAADSWVIDVDLWSASTDARLSKGRITWSICDFSSNTYDRVMGKAIGQAVVYYIVYNSAFEERRRHA